VSPCAGTGGPGLSQASREFPTLTSTAADSGGGSAGTVWWKAASGQSPVVSGGVRVTGWTKGSDGVVIQNNHNITGPEQMPSTVVAAGGIEPAYTSILSWQPA
jgi:hypothetical protein